MQNAFGTYFRTTYAVKHPINICADENFRTNMHVEENVKTRKLCTANLVVANSFDCGENDIFVGHSHCASLSRKMIDSHS